jgi:hypothetical protein
MRPRGGDSQHCPDVDCRTVRLKRSASEFWDPVVEQYNENSPVKLSH